MEKNPYSLRGKANFIFSFKGKPMNETIQWKIGSHAGVDV